MGCGCKGINCIIGRLDCDKASRSIRMIREKREANKKVESNMTDEQKQQMKGYTRAVQEMSAQMEASKPGELVSVTIAMEKLESKMREKVLRLVEQSDK